MVLGIPAILTLVVVPLCTSAPLVGHSRAFSWGPAWGPASGPAWSPSSEPTRPIGREIPRLDEVTLDFAPPIRIPIVSADGRRVSGPWDMATVRGLQAEDGGSIDWSDLAAEERLRVGRRIVAASPSDPEVAWGLLVVALETIEDGPMTQQIGRAHV